MHYLFLILFSLFLLQGCKPEVIIKPVSECNVSQADTFTIYNQTFERPQSVPLKHIQLRPTLTQGEINSASVKILSIDTLKPDVALQYELPEPSLLLALNLRHVGYILDDDADLRESAIKTMTISYAMSFNSREKKLVKTLGMTERHVLLNSDEVLTQQLTLSPQSFYVDESVKEVEQYRLYSDRNISVLYITLQDVHAIIEQTLLMREDRAKNEALLQQIALNNRSYYQTLLKDKTRFLLPKQSIAYLPKDASLLYAVEHLAEIYQSGKYKTVKGRYNILIDDSQVTFDARRGKHKRHAIQAKKSKKRKKSVGDIPEGDNFIDFSKGL